MPLSGLLSEYGFDGGWPSIFYVFGFVGVIWSVAFLIFVHEDPSTHPSIDEKEKKYINSALWGTTNVTVSVVDIIFFLFAFHSNCPLCCHCLCEMEIPTKYRLYRDINFHIAHIVHILFCV